MKKQDTVSNHIRCGKEAPGVAHIKRMIREGYADLAQGRFFKSTGDFRKDLKLAEKL